MITSKLSSMFFVLKQSFDFFEIYLDVLINNHIYLIN